MFTRFLPLDTDHEPAESSLHSHILSLYPLPILFKTLVCDTVTPNLSGYFNLKIIFNMFIILQGAVVLYSTTLWRTHG
jgi:hypothetical protein